MVYIVSWTSVSAPHWPVWPCLCLPSSTFRAYQLRYLPICRPTASASFRSIMQLVRLCSLLWSIPRPRIHLLFSDILLPHFLSLDMPVAPSFPFEILTPVLSKDDVNIALSSVKPSPTLPPSLDLAVPAPALLAVSNTVCNSDDTSNNDHNSRDYNHTYDPKGFGKWHKRQPQASIVYTIRRAGTSSILRTTQRAMTAMVP